MFFVCIQQCREECSHLTESIGTLGIGTYISSFSPNGEPIQARGVHPLQNAANRRARSRSYLPSVRQQGQGSYTGPPAGTAHPEEGLPTDLEDFTSGGTSSAPPAATPPMTPSVAVEGASGNTQSDATPPATATGDSPLGQSQGATTPSAGNATPSTSTSSPKLVDRFHPLATATLSTTVFDVVHLFSDLGISAVPIVDNETGQVINLYEAVDVVDLVRSNAYQVLDLTIEDALSRRSKDFPGVVTCTPEDSLASILAYVREKRAHRFVIVEGEDTAPEMEGAPVDMDRPKKIPGRLLGVLCLSDILK